MSFTVGSLCSGIEAASSAWLPLNFKFEWFSEIEEYPSSVLKKHYPDVANLGDMCNVPQLIDEGKIATPDIICSGTPCQAFSLTGYRDGMSDERGQLTLKFVEIVDSNDKKRLAEGKNNTIFFWENVEGVLSDDTNAFGIMISSLAGLDRVIEKSRWPNAGLIRGPKRNIAWRVLDAKYFGLPQQRKRVYLLGGGPDFHPENILFEEYSKIDLKNPYTDLTFIKDGIRFEVFREYTDCLYAAYGTKWNGNAAAYNGSLYVLEDGRLRRLTVNECEKLMGFPEDYTALSKSGVRDFTPRYRAVGNSWAVPVINWIGKRIESTPESWSINDDRTEQFQLFLFPDQFLTDSGVKINCSDIPQNPVFGNMFDIVEHCEYDRLFLSPTACHGILRRAEERNVRMNPRLASVMDSIAKSVPIEEIERISRVQPRGEHSLRVENDNTSKSQKNLYRKKKDALPVAVDERLESTVETSSDACVARSRVYKQTTLFD